MATRKTNQKTARAKASRKALAKVQHKGLITVCKNTEGGAHVYVQADDGRSFTRPRSGDSRAFRQISAVGQPYDAALKWHESNPAPKPQARLARGIGSGDAPQSAAAVAAQRKEQGKAKARTAKAAKAKQPSRGVDRDYSVGKTEVTAKPDSWRYHMLTVIRKHTNTARARAAHEKSGKFSGNKLDFNWAAAQGYINWAK